MKKWQWILLAVLSYLVCLLIYMPAQHVTNFVQSNSQSPLRFNGVMGTLFSGNARSVSYEGLQINEVSWELSALSLLILNADLDIKGGAIRNPDNIYIDGNLSVPLTSPDTFTLNNARIFIPAKPLFAQVELPVVVTALGRLRVDIENFEFDNGCQILNGKGSWLQASLNIEGSPLDLGDFNASLLCETPNYVLQVAPENGISLDATITFDQTGKYAAVGTFAIPSDFPNVIKQSAPFFGTSIGQGRYELNVKSRTPL